MNIIAKDFADMRAALLAWSETGDGNTYEDLHDIGRRIVAAVPQDRHDAELQGFTGLLLAFGFTAEAPLEIDMRGLSDETVNVDMLSALVETLSAATRSARYHI